MQYQSYKSCWLGAQTCITVHSKPKIAYSKYKDWGRLNQRRHHPSEPFLLVADIQPVPVVPSGPKTSTKPLRSSLLDISPSPDVWERLGFQWIYGSEIRKIQNIAERERLIFPFSGLFSASMSQSWLLGDLGVVCQEPHFLWFCWIRWTLGQLTLHILRREETSKPSTNKTRVHTTHRECKEPSWTKDPKTAPTADSIDFFI